MKCCRSLFLRTLLQRSILIAPALMAIVPGTTQAQILRTYSVEVRIQDNFSQNIQFLCTQGYDRVKCQQDIRALRHRLTSYPVERLGPWSFAIASSWEMQSVVHDLGGDLKSPGLTALDRRITVFDEAIFNTATPRHSQILEWLHFVRDSELLEFVLTHELGHAICRDPDEARAADNGEKLRRRTFSDCKSNLRKSYTLVANEPPR
jgi:hypothetical protein